MKHINIGFTGSRKPLNDIQAKSLRGRFHRIHIGHDSATLHHGDCVGADAAAHSIVKEFGFSTELHPPDKDDFRAFCEADIVRKPLPYLRRNKEIVDACDILVACPNGPEVRRSGPWSTVRYARKKGKQIVIVMPDGSVTREPEAN